MSIKQEFMKTLLLPKYPDSIESGIISKLRYLNLTFYSSISDISDILDDIETSNNQLTYSDDIREFRKFYHLSCEIESYAIKVCGLYYSRWILYAASLDEIYINIEQNRTVFEEKFKEWKEILDQNISLLSFWGDGCKILIEILTNHYTNIADVIRDYLYYINDAINNKLIEGPSHSSRKDFLIRPNPLYLSEADRNELYELSHAIPFNTLLLQYIDESGMTDANVYKAAGISKQVFSYIRNNKLSSLKKEKIVSICIVLKLDMEKTQRLLASCGYGLSEYVPFDRIIIFCISKGCYDVDEINELLYEFNQPTICGIKE